MYPGEQPDDSSPRDQALRTTPKFRVIQCTGLHHKSILEWEVSLKLDFFLLTPRDK